MKIVIFENQMWNEIPQKDNPAFDYKDNEGNRGHDCIMVVKALPYEQKCVGENGYVVIYVPFQGDIVRVGMFWSIDSAERFANTWKE